MSQFWARLSEFWGTAGPVWGLNWANFWGLNWASLGVKLGRFGVKLGRFEVKLGRFNWDQTQPLLEPQPSWFWGQTEPVWGPSAASLGRDGAVWGAR